MTEPTQLHALADGELAPQEAALLREALKADPRAAAEVDAVLNLKDLLAKNAVAHAADPAVWKGCVARLDALDKTRRVEGFFGRYAWGLCAVMFLFILSGRVAMRTAHGDSASAAEVTRTFSGSFATVSRADKTQSRRFETILHEVGLNLDPTEIEVGTPVRAVFHNFPALLVPMRDGQGDLQLTRVAAPLNFQDTAPLPTNPDLGFGVADGENCVVWRAGDSTWLLSGTRSAEALGEIAARLRVPQ